MAELINVYRPTDFDEVWGQEDAVASLERLVEADDSHAFLFVGPSGVGKTTLARIIAMKKGCDRRNLLEMDAASHSGVESIRDLTQRIQYKGMGSATRVVIIDECHSLSKNAWQALLKALEEPPEHVYWCLCTTEEGKVPKTIGTRCSTIRLGPVPEDDLFDFLVHIRDSEGYSCDDEVLALVAKRADGSPRDALSKLSVVASADSRQSAAAMLRTFVEGDEAVLEFCRAMFARADFGIVRPLLAALMGLNAEGIRIQVCAYMRKVILDEKGKSRNVARAAEILHEFGTPFPTQGQDDQLVLATLRACFQE